MPREAVDALENLLEEPPCQVAFGQLEDKVPGMPDEAPPRFGWTQVCLADRGFGRQD